MNIEYLKSIIKNTNIEKTKIQYTIQKLIMIDNLINKKQYEVDKENNLTKNKKFNYIYKQKNKLNKIEDIKLIDDPILHLLYLYAEKSVNNNVINVPLSTATVSVYQEERKEDINTTNYVSKEKYDKIKKNNNHYKQQIEQRNSMIKDSNEQIFNLKEELKDVYKKYDTLEVNYKKLEIEHSNLHFNYKEVKEQNYDLQEENANLYKELSKLKKQYDIV